MSIELEYPDGPAVGKMSLKADAMLIPGIINIYKTGGRSDGKADADI